MNDHVEVQIKAQENKQTWVRIGVIGICKKKTYTAALVGKSNVIITVNTALAKYCVVMVSYNAPQNDNKRIH